jgi:hypothetical protein
MFPSRRALAFSAVDVKAARFSLRSPRAAGSCPPSSSDPFRQLATLFTLTCTTPRGNQTAQNSRRDARALLSLLLHLRVNDCIDLGSDCGHWIVDGLWRLTGYFSVTVRAFPLPNDGYRDLMLRCYFVTMRFATGGVAAAGEITNVSQVFQPDGRFKAPNSA